MSDLRKNFNSIDKKPGEIDDGLVDLNEAQVESKQLRSALAFLQHIDPSGYLASISDPTKLCGLHDESLQERYERIENITRSMDVQQYLEYSKVL